MSRSVETICEIVREDFGRLAARASADSPFAKAREKLGDRFADVAAKALQARTLAVLTGSGAEEALRMIEAAGDLGAKTVIVGIVADAIQDVIAAAA